MQKSKIEWTDYTINPVKGLCPMACSYCYARAMYKRFKWNPEIKYDDWVWQTGGNIPSGSKIFVGSTMELFGEWVKPEWLQTIFDYCRSCPSHTFIFLTKQPQNLSKWAFPDNCWVGVSITSAMDCIVRLPKMANVSARVKFVSFEPLLKPIAPPNQLYITLKLSGINWVIIGQQTPSKPETAPKIEWIKEIVGACDTATIPVFLKNNLANVLCLKSLDGLIPTGLCTNYGHSLRQEYPVKEGK